MQQLLTPSEVADRLKVAVVTLKEWRLAGHGPRYLRFGERLVRYRAEDVERWEQEQTREPGEGRG